MCQKFQNLLIIYIERIITTDLLFLNIYIFIFRLRMSAFTNPSFPEIIRATQKDDHVMTQLTNEISSNVLLKILGPRGWIPWKQWIEASVHFAYFAITTFSGTNQLLH